MEGSWGGHINVRPCTLVCLEKKITKSLIKKKEEKRTRKDKR